MKTWKTIVVTLGLVAMSGVAWGHGAPGRSPGRGDAIDPPETIAHARIGVNDVVGIPTGGHGRVQSIDVARRRPPRSASVAAVTRAPEFGVQTVAAVALLPIPEPTLIVAERFTFPPNRKLGTRIGHHPAPIPIPGR